MILLNQRVLKCLLFVYCLTGVHLVGGWWMVDGGWFECRSFFFDFTSFFPHLFLFHFIFWERTERHYYQSHRLIDFYRVMHLQDSNTCRGISEIPTRLQIFRNWNFAEKKTRCGPRDTSCTFHSHCSVQFLVASTVGVHFHFHLFRF